MTTAAIIAVGFAGFAGVYLCGRFAATRTSREQRRAVDRLRALNTDADAPELAPNESIRSFKDVMIALGLRLSSKPALDGATNRANDDLRTRLALAGYRQPTAVVLFSLIQIGLVIGLALAAGGTAGFLGSGWRKCILLGAAGAAVGLLGPSMLLGAQMAKRKRRLQRAFPDALDILVLSIEGGASITAAIAWVSEEISAVHPLLGEEWLLVQREVQFGLPPSEAFQLFATRNGLDEARDLAAALLQSERYGASLSKALRNFADAARHDRQVWAEEVAQKAAVKIIFPMLLCIFPAIFIVLLGPAAAQMSRLFAK